MDVAILGTVAFVMSRAAKLTPHGIRIARVVQASAPRTAPARRGYSLARLRALPD